MTGLNRSLSLTDLTLFGVASIMGSGGFNLIGSAVREGGVAWPAAFGTAAALLMGAAFVYAEAHDRFKKNTSETDMIRTAFGHGAESIGAIAILVYNIVSIVVILVFCSKMLLPSGGWFSQVSLTLFMLASMAGLALVGIELDKQIIDVVTWVLIAFLSVAAILGFVYGVGKTVIPYIPGVFSAPVPETKVGDFKKSLWLFFFVLVGFDAIVKFTEEATDGSDIPTAFYLSNGISDILTYGVALAIAALLPGLTVAKEGNAFGWLFAAFVGDWIVLPVEWVVVVFLLLTTFVVFLATSRYLYGLGAKSEWLTSFREISVVKAPWVATLSVFGVGAGLSLLNNTDLLVKITDLGFAVIASLVSAAVSAASFQEGAVITGALSGATGVGFFGLIASAFL